MEYSQMKELRMARSLKTMALYENGCINERRLLGIEKKGFGTAAASWAHV